MNSADKQLLVGIDVGTTSVKGAAYTVSGDCCFSKSIAYEVVETPVADRVEQDPGVWMAAIRDICATIVQALADYRVAAVGVVSQVNTHVFVDAEGEPLLNAIVWQDQRCAGAAKKLDDKIPASLRNRYWGENFKVDASFLMSRALWLHDTHPKIWAKTRWILSPKDYCLMCLTGEVSSDAMSSIGVVDEQGRYIAEALELVPGLAERLPPLKNITGVVGFLKAQFGMQCPAVVSTMDAWGSVFGSGATGHGDAIQVSGTSEIIAAISKWKIGSEGVIGFPPFNGWYLYAGPTQLGGSAANWLSEFLGCGIEEVFELASAARSQPGSSKKAPLIFLPHTMGERAPLWDSQARGAFIGMDRRHDCGDLAHAVLQGVGFASRLLLGAVEQAAGYGIEQLMLSGGASRSDLWCQIKADILQVPLKRLKNTDTGTFGAALLAGVGAGVYRDFGEASRQAVEVEKMFEPDTRLAGYYDELFNLYIESYRALKPINARMHALAERKNEALDG